LWLGVVKSIGVSNYTRDHLEELLQYCRIKPAVLQVSYLMMSPRSCWDMFSCLIVDIVHVFKAAGAEVYKLNDWTEIVLYVDVEYRNIDS